MVVYPPQRRREDSHVIVLVEFDRKVPGHVPAAIVVSVILHEVIHVVKDQTVPVQVFHGLLVAHVKQHCSVKWLRAPLETGKVCKDFITTRETNMDKPYFILCQ